MILTKTVIMKWYPNNKSRYVNKGYLYTKMGNEFEVKIEDLANCSHASVLTGCDSCGISTKTSWHNYKKYVKQNGEYFCNKCAKKLYSNENSRLTKLSKSKSFEEWCHDNLSVENANDLLSRWDYSLNIMTPKDVSFSSNKRYWLKCPVNTEHESEQKIINNYTSGQKKSVDCYQCHSVATTHPELVVFFANKNDATKYSIGSHNRVSVKCPNCGHEKEMIVYHLVKGICCPRCSDNFPYPEKFLFSVLNQLGVDFSPQLTRKTFEWCGIYRYDYYIDSIDCIIEVHGLQHYEDATNWGSSLADTQNNDNYKEHLASKNGITNYITLDCRSSKISWIKNSIMASDLPKILNFKDDDIDWLKCHRYSCSGIVSMVCKTWTDGTKSILGISKKLKISKDTVRRYLRKGAIIGMCDYAP